MPHQMAIRYNPVHVSMLVKFVAPAFGGLAWIWRHVQLHHCMVATRVTCHMQLSESSSCTPSHACFVQPQLASSLTAQSGILHFKHYQPCPQGALHRLVNERMIANMLELVCTRSSAKASSSSSKHSNPGRFWPGWMLCDKFGVRHLRYSAWTAQR